MPAPLTCTPAEYLDQWSIPIPECGCRIWLGHCFPKIGYGCANWRRQSLYAHRFSWIVHRGPIPDGMNVLHSYDVRPCIEPTHLFLGTQADNVHDMIKKGRNVVLRGSQTAVAILTEADVEEIKMSPEGCREIARRFGISHSGVSRIRNGKIWKHVR